MQQVGSGTSKYGNQCDCRLSLSNDVYETTIYIENITLVMKTTQQTRVRTHSKRARAHIANARAGELPYAPYLQYLLALPIPAERAREREDGEFLD